MQPDRIFLRKEEIMPYAGGRIPDKESLHVIKRLIYEIGFTAGYGVVIADYSYPLILK